MCREYEISVSMTDVQKLPILKDGTRISVALSVRYRYGLQFNGFLANRDGKYKFGYIQQSFKELKLPDGTVGREVVEEEFWYDDDDVEEWALLSYIYDKE